MERFIDPVSVPLAPEDARTIDGIQLVRSPVGVELVTASLAQEASGILSYRMILRKMSLAPSVSDPLPLLEVGLLLPSPVGWEAALHADGRSSVVYEYNGGAVNALLLEDSQGVKKAVSGRYPFNSFHHPHFARGSHVAAAARVVASRDKKEIVLFEQGPDGQFADLRVIVQGVDAVLLEAAQEKWLLFRDLISGPARFNRLPGTLYVTQLTSEYEVQAVHPAFSEDLVCYDFDACTDRESVYLVVISNRGALLFKGSLGENPVQFVPMAVVSHQNGELTQPTILRAGGDLHVAMVVNAQQESAGIVHAKMPAGASAR